MTAAKKTAPAKAAPAKKAPAKKAAAEEKPKRAANKGKTCSVKGCGKDAYVKGRCSAHDAQERRKDPAVREKAREASRRSYAKRAEAAKLKAPSDTIGGERRPLKKAAPKK